MSVQCGLSGWAWQPDVVVAGGASRSASVRAGLAGGEPSGEVEPAASDLDERAGGLPPPGLGLLLELAEVGALVDDFGCDGAGLAVYELGDHRLGLGQHGFMVELDERHPASGRREVEFELVETQMVNGRFDLPGRRQPSLLPPLRRRGPGRSPRTCSTPR